jgi:hypothetical protein
MKGRISVASIVEFVRVWAAWCWRDHGVRMLWHFPYGLLRAAFYWPILCWHDHDH